MANYSVLAGIGNALSEAQPNYRKQKQFETDQAKAALDMALERQNMDQNAKLFAAKLPFEQSAMDRYRLDALMKDPDYLGVPGATDLMTKLGVPTPQGAQPTSLDNIVQSGVYGNGVPVSPNRQAAIANDLTGIRSNQMVLNMYDNINKLLPSLVNGMPGANQPPAPPQPNSATQPPASGQPAVPGVTSSALPPADKRVEGQTYLLPTGKSATWTKGPSGQFGLVAVPEANGTSVPSPSGNAFQMNPNLDKQAFTLNLLGNLPGPFHGMKANEVPSLKAADAAQTAAATERAKKDALGYIPPATELRAMQAAKSASTIYGQAIQMMEQQFPQIDKAYNVLMTQHNSPSVGNWLMGKTLPYDDAGSTMKMFAERKKYDPLTSGGLGMATPFGKSIAATNFANVGAMMGLNPGTRAVGILSQLYAQHQPQWGYESPLQTYTKLRYLRDEGLQQVLDAIKHPEIEKYPTPPQQ